MTTNKAALYIRVSTDEQSRNGHSLEAQTERLKAYCEFRNLDVTDIFVDRGVSGGSKIADRPAGSALLLALHSQKAHHVVATKLDRLFRNVPDCLQTVLDWTKRGFGLHFVDLGGLQIDTTTPTGTFMLTIMAAVNELERNMASERTSEVMRSMRNRGMYTGGNVPYGYSVSRDGLLVPDADEISMLKYAKSLKESGKSLRDIGKTLKGLGFHPKNGGEWQPEKVKAALRAEF